MRAFENITSIFKKSNKNMYMKPLQTIKQQTTSFFAPAQPIIKPKNINPITQQPITKVPKIEDYRNIRIGFIGVGTISKAMVTGLCNPELKDQMAQKIIVSPRSKKNADELAANFEQVKIAQNNQEVIDNSDWVVVGLLTTQIKDVLKDLTFRKDQTIINLAAMPNEEFSNSVNDSKQIIRACPLPPIALNVGATIVSPPHPQVQEMFDALGQSVAVSTSHETYSLQGLACLQGAQFGIMEATYDWMVNNQKIDPEIAKKYVIGTFHSILVDAMDKISNKNHSFQDLIDEQTPGGLNEQNLKYLNEQGLNKHFKDALDNTYNKMTSK